MALTPDQLAKAARRVSRERAFVGWVLSRFAESEGIPLDQLASRLKATPEAFGHLHLCLRPRAASFAEDVELIARHAGVNAAELAAIVRRVDALEAMADAAATEGAGTLLAARARKAKGET